VQFYAKYGHLRRTKHIQHYILVIFHIYDKSRQNKTADFPISSLADLDTVRATFALIVDGPLRACALRACVSCACALAALRPLEIGLYETPPRPREVLHLSRVTILLPRDPPLLHFSARCVSLTRHERTGLGSGSDRPPSAEHLQLQLFQRNLAPRVFRPGKLGLAEDN